MTPKERFTVYKHIKSNKGVIVDNTTGETISEKECSDIIRKEYGERISAREGFIGELSSEILHSLKSYNMSCEKGFQIATRRLF